MIGFISDLRERPQFAEFVADRVWRAWWKSRGYDLAYVDALVRQSLNDAPLPFTLVAHDGAQFLGTAAVIASDLASRPQYTPWLAAVWVEPDHRSGGVGSALVQTAAHRAQVLGHYPVYLNALPINHGFYQRLGWRLVEADVDDAGLAVFRSPYSLV